MREEDHDSGHRRSNRRGGRPPADQAGEVDRRILEAASALFLEQGFDATSCEQVAATAGAGKASIYARYANKEALFAAAVRHHVERSPASAVEAVMDGPVEARLRAVGRSILDHATRPDAIALTRVVLATAHRMPELARLADRIGRDGAARRVAEAIAGQDRDAETVRRAERIAERFIDLAFVPHQMRALIGDDTIDLAANVGARVDGAVELLSRGGWLDDWH